MVVITGGARGVTAEVAVALAEAFRPTLVVLGRSPEPDGRARLARPARRRGRDQAGLAARANGHATPQAIGEQFRQVAANREVLGNLRRIEEAGARVVYRSVDVRDGAAVRSAIASIRAEFGPVRGLVHGAGVLADRRIEDQTDEQFARVFDTKVGGLDALLAAIGPDDLRVLVLFSSSTARFGRTGQVAYAAANEVLNKWAQARGPGPARLPGRLGQLGPVGRRDGHAALRPAVRGRGGRPDPDRPRGPATSSTRFERPATGRSRS